jgi:hypothetical protein
MTHHAHRLPAPVAFALVALAALFVPSVARAETIACRSTASTVKAVTIAEDYFRVTRLFQFDSPSLEPLLETTISVVGPGQTCVVASFSAVVRPSDNYLVFQVTLDGVPMHGHSRFYVQPSTPVVIEMEETDLNVPRMVAHQFFLRVDPGVHTVRVSVARGSGPGPFDPSVEAPVLSIQYN